MPAPGPDPHRGTYPIVCLHCGHPLESGSGSAAPVAGPRHPASMRTTHLVAPGFARTCAFCAAGGPLWFLAYADTPAGAVSGAVSLCAACRTDLEAGDGDPVLERALALLDPAVSQAARNREHRRVRERIAWLLTHRVGVPRLARDLLIEAPRAAPATPDSARNTT